MLCKLCDQEIEKSNLFVDSFAEPFHQTCYEEYRADLKEALLDPEFFNRREIVPDM